VTVSVSQGVHERLAGLPQALGPAVEVAVGDPHRAAVILVGAIGPAGAAFLRARYPAARLMVLGQCATGADGAPGAPGAPASAYLDAGADAYVAGASLAEIAAHVRALLRRPSGGTVPLPRVPPVVAPPVTELLVAELPVTDLPSGRPGRPAGRSGPPAGVTGRQAS
jgi:hypothetical protein